MKISYRKMELANFHGVAKKNYDTGIPCRRRGTLQTRYLPIMAHFQVFRIITGQLTIEMALRIHQTWTHCVDYVC